MTRLRVRGVLVLGAAAFAVSGCAAAAITTPAKHSTDTTCSTVIAQLTGVKEVNGLERREVSAQATAAWGDDASVQLRCGLDPLGPSTDVCQSVGGVDWVARQENGRTLLTSYGRAPAVEISVAGEQPTGLDAILDTLSPAVSTLPTNGRACT